MKSSRILVCCLVMAIFILTTGFTTHAAPLNAPAPFSKIAPSSGSTNQPSVGTVLTWSASATPNVTYSVCITGNPNNKCPGSKWLSAGSATSYAIPANTLVAGSKYYWQVRATDASGSVDADNGQYWNFTTFAAPAPFGKLSPVSGMEGLSPASLVLTWQASSNFTHYEYCVDTTADNACSTNWVNSGTTASATLTNLLPVQQYYWQVRAVNVSGWREANTGAWWTFSTSVARPGAFSKSAPANSEPPAVVSLNPTLSWAASSTASSYEVCVVDDITIPCDGHWSLAGAGNTYALNGLDYGQEYFWQVRARNIAGTTEANAGARWRFVTIQAPPAAFVKTGPVNLSSNQPVDLNLTWSPSAGAAYYEYCFDTQPAHSACDNPANWVQTNATSAQLSDTELDYGPSTYFWQVRAINSEGVITRANEGEWWQFSTLQSPLGPFFKVLPADGAVHQLLNPTLLWTASEGILDRYEYCIVTDITTACNWVAGNTESFVPLTGLAYDTTYHWQIRAISGGVPQGFADGLEDHWFTFTTVPQPPTSQGESLSVAEDTTLNVELLKTFHSPNMNTAIFNVYGAPPAAKTFSLSASGQLLFTPVTNFHGQVSFQFRVRDGINPPSEPYTVTIEVTPVNDPPVLQAIPNEVVLTGELVTFTALASDNDALDGDTVSFSIKESLTNGPTINAQSGLFTWVPVWKPGAPKQYLFTVVAADQNGGTSERTVTITLNPYRLLLAITRR